MTPRTLDTSPSQVAQGAGKRRAAWALALTLFCLATLFLALPLQARSKSGQPHPDKASLVGLAAAPSGSNLGLPYETTAAQDRQNPDAHGGPDQYGYVFDDDLEPGGPTYAWQPGTLRIPDTAWQKIVNTGATTLDDGVITDTLPFAFNYYGTAYNQVHISTNGNIHFGSPSDWYPGYSGACLPSPSQYVPQGMIAPLWYDFVVPGNVTNYGVFTTVTGLAPNRTYVVEWRRVYKYQTPTTYATFEVLLDENTGNMRFQYQELTGTDTGGAGGVIGIQNQDGTIGLPYSCYVNSVIPGRAIRYKIRQAAILSPGRTSQGGAPGATVTYNENLANQTGIANSFTLVASGNTWTTTVQPANTGTIANGQSVPIVVQVQIPNNVRLTAHDTVTITASSALPTSGAYTATAVLTTSVTSNGADFTPPDQSQAGDFGSTVTYTARITNTSPIANTFDISTEDNQWATSVYPTQTGSLNPNQAASVQVAVQVPASSTLGDSDVVTVRATGEFTTPGQYFGFTALTTTAGIWSERAYMPVARSRGAGVYFPGNGRLYAIGGTGNNGNSNLPIEEYDPTTDSWRDRANLVVPVSNVGAAVIGNAIFIPGGYNPATGQAETVLQVYYPQTNQVEVISGDPLPQPRMGAGVAAARGKLYVIGGADSSLIGTDTVFEYDPGHAPGASGWTQKASMTSPRVYLAAATVDNVIYAAGGMPGAPYDLNVVERFDPLTDTWSAASPMNNARAGLALVGVDSGQPGCGGRLYALGGGWQNYSESVESFSVVSNSWQLASDLTEARRSLDAAYSPATHSIVAFGGWSGLYEVIAEAAPCGGGPYPPTPTPTITVTPCPMNFSDVSQSDYFYQAVSYLYCEGAISGYGDNTFRPYNNTTRGQLSKIVALAEGWPINTQGGPHFSDVPADSAFYAYVETAYNRGVISGYADGTFRPNANITRAQLTKIVVNAEGWPIDITGGPHFSDVPATDPFYGFIETAFNKGIISGYADNTFRPGYPATRGQIAKIVFNAVTAP